MKQKQATSSSPRMLLLLAMALAMATAADAQQECTSLTQNTLTSAGCPASCGTASPCVLYAPSLATTKPCTTLGASGPCQNQTDFTVPGYTSTCDVTYQCLDAIMSGSQWLLAVDVIKGADKVSVAYVTEINSIKYNAASTFSVQLVGGATLTTPKGNMKEVVLDQSFFDTPAITTSMFLMHLNLRNALSTLKLSTSITTLSLVNVNLDQFPAQLSSFNLGKLDLSKNYIKSFANATALTSLKNLKTLNLAENDLTSLPDALPAIDTLNLTGNPLGAIPDVVFTTPTLKNLYMKDCNLTNIQLTDAQFTFLDQLTTFDAAITVTECAKGFATRTLQGTSVCFASVSTGGGSNTTAIVIGVVGGALALCVIAFLVLRHRRKRGIMDPSDKGTYSMYDGMTDGTNGVSNGSDTLGSSIWNDPDLLAVRIDHRDVEPIKLLARGGFGEVWLGLYMNENVAIKRLLSDKKSMNDALQFATEIRLMARLDHPKIVRFIGVSWSNALTIQAITEFMDCGDLKSLLDSNRSSSLTWANLKCQIAIDIADALVYLHTLNPKMIHRDLKSRNVLIDAQTGAKLSDFGISRDRSVEETMTAGVGTARWIAPEVVLGGHYTEAADIYSYGVVLSELDTCKAPFHDAQNTNGAKMQDVTILQLVSAGKLQPSFTDHCLPSILKLARSCLEFDPTRRPTAMQIMYELRNILKNELK